MTEIVKEAFKLAEKELKDNEKLRIKEVVKATLEKLRKKEAEKHAVDEEIKILRKDIEDLKEGRIDRIKERQDIDAKAREVSVIIIKEKIIEKQVPMWYQPWVIEVKKEYIPYFQPYCTNATIGNAMYTLASTADSNTITCNASFTSTNSEAHLYSTGTYQLSDGTVKYI